MLTLLFPNAKVAVLHRAVGGVSVPDSHVVLVHWAAHEEHAAVRGSGSCQQQLRVSETTACATVIARCAVSLISIVNCLFVQCEMFLCLNLKIMHLTEASLTYGTPSHCVNTCGCIPFVPKWD